MVGIQVSLARLSVGFESALADINKGAVALRRAATIYGRRYLQISAIYSGDTV